MGVPMIFEIITGAWFAVMIIWMVGVGVLIILAGKKLDTRWERDEDADEG